jgi:ribonuclease G
VNAGDDILVQVIKDPIGSKGARLTTFIALPSRYLVYMPRGEAIGVSARIEDETERLRLKAMLAELISDGAGGGYIVRTAAQGASRESLSEDMGYLARLWEHVRSRAAEASPGSVVHEDLPLTLRVLRDELARGVSGCWSTLRASSRACASLPRPSCPRPPLSLSSIRDPGRCLI